MATWYCPRAQSGSGCSPGQRDRIQPGGRGLMLTFALGPRPGDAPDRPIASAQRCVFRVSCGSGGYRKAHERTI